MWPGIHLPNGLFTYDFDVTPGDTYESFRGYYMDMVRRCPAGVSELFVHPCIEAPELKYINAQWKKRVWEYQVIFNFSNPSGLVTQALADAGYRRVVGLCDAPSNVKTRMAARLGLAEDELHLKMFGLNHLSWIQSVKSGETELLPQLLEDEAFLSDIPEFSVFDRDVHQLTHYLPNEYLYYYYHRERALRNILTAETRRGRQIYELNRLMWEELRTMDISSELERALQTFLYYIYQREYSYMAAESDRKNGPVHVERGNLTIPKNMGYAGVMLDCIQGLQSSVPREAVVCVPNRGCIPFLRDSDIVEVSCLVDTAGFHPVELDRNIPDHCVQLISTIKSYERKAVEAIRQDSDLLAAEALTLHPLVFSYSLAKELLRDDRGRQCKTT